VNVWIWPILLQKSVAGVGESAILDRSARGTVDDGAAQSAKDAMTAAAAKANAAIHG
jgi:hypothetical protein